jgi:hypothetical protein
MINPTAKTAVRFVMQLRDEVREQLGVGTRPASWADNNITERIVAQYVQAAATYALTLSNLTVYSVEP